MGRHALVDVVQEWTGHAPDGSGRRKGLVAIAPVPGGLARLSACGWWHHVIEPLAALRQESVEVDHMGDTLGSLVTHAGHHHARIAVADENDVVKLFLVEQCHDLVDMRVEVDVRTVLLLPLRQALERRRKHPDPGFSSSGFTASQAHPP